MFIIDLCQKLKQANIPYAVVGGYAVALHGAVRGTVDIDLAIEFSHQSVVNIAKALFELGLKPLHPMSPKEVYLQRKNS